MNNDNLQNEKTKVSWWIPEDLYEKVKALAVNEFQAGGKANLMAVTLIQEAVSLRERKAKKEKAQ